MTPVPDPEPPVPELRGGGSPGDGPSGADGPATVVSCRLCGAVAPAAGAAALTWLRDRDDRGRDRWLCTACARRHVRDIEAKLPAEWW